MTAQVIRRILWVPATVTSLAGFRSSSRLGLTIKRLEPGGFDRPGNCDGVIGKTEAKGGGGGGVMISF